MARATFHHGGLREAAIEAALEYALTGPIDSLDMRKLATTCGVHQRAFYRHFSNKQELIEAAGARAFEMLNAEIAAAKPQSTKEFLRIYTQFALSAPDRYDLMMGGMKLEQGGALLPAVQILVQTAVQIFSAQSASTTEVGSMEIRDAVVRKWAQVHGMIDLWRRGVLRGKDTDSMVEYILSSAED